MSSSGNRTSGDGSSVQEFSHYDFINAPQFVDFADLARHDDPNADVFFETHREEDDFMIPIENISPTIQLLNSNEQNILSASQNKVNKAVAQAGMEDVKVVYYSSPSANGGNKGKVLSGSGAMKSKSLNSSVMSSSSFYTPVGGCNYADKENCAPSPTDSQCSTPTAVDEAITCKKLSYSNADDTEKEQNEEESNLNTEPGKNSLLDLLDKFSILSSDEEDIGEEINNISYISPTETPNKTDETLIETILNTPGGAQQQKKVSDGSILSVKNKLDFFKGISLDDSVEEETTEEKQAESNVDATCVVGSNDSNEQYYRNEFPIFPGPSGPTADDRKQSFLVDPTIGQEVVWNNDDPVNLKSGAISLARTISNCSSIRSLNDDEDVNNHYYGSDADDTLTSSFDGYKDCLALIDAEKLDKNAQKLRRASSLSDLNKLQNMAKTLINKPITNKARNFLTMPQSPEASRRRPTRCKSAIKAPAGSLATAAPHAMTQTSISRIPKSDKFQPKPNGIGSKLFAVPYKPSRGVQRVPLKANHYVSLAESIIRFQKSTPDRFRTLPSKGRVPIKRSASCDSQNGDGLIPKSSNPTAATAGFSRSRTSSVSSSTGGNSGSTSTMTFHTVNSATTNLNKLASLPKKATVPQPFHFSTTRPRATVETKEVAPDAFKARPAPKIKATTVGNELNKDRPLLRVTQAIAPHFASDDRIRERNEKKAQSAQHSPARFTRPASTHPTRSARNPNTTGNRAQTVEIGARSATTFKPFSFDQRDQDTLRRKEAKIKQELEEGSKVKEFHANPLPSFTPKLPKKKAVPTTNIQPFHLKSDERGEAYQEALKLKLEEEERKLKEIATFHANPPVVLSKPAFEPEHPLRPPMEPLEFHLSTEQRALEREQFELHLKQKEMDEEAKRRQEQEKHEELVKLEEMEKRRQLVHKAKPFRPSRAFQLRASEKVLTIPLSPAFLPLPSQRRTSPSKQNKLQSLSDH